MKVKEFKGKRISNLYAYLMDSDEDVIIVRTSQVAGCWYDNEFDAHAAGFAISRFINKEMEARHEFPECYCFTRK